MKKAILTFLLLSNAFIVAQEHFSGINISRRVGILNATINPAELNNLNSKYEANAFNFSINVANNKVSFSDIFNGENFEEKFFTGEDPANARVDALIHGPAFAMKYKKWGFAVISTGHIKANAVDVDINLGNALTNSFVGVADINANYNQRMNAAAWGEIGLSTSRNFFDNNIHKFNAGATLRLIFPGSYMNLGVSNLQGDITNVLGNVELTNATAQVNIAYSGSLANNYDDTSNYSKLFAGGLNGVAADIGFNYQWKQKVSEEENSESTSSDYKLNIGLSIRNMGGMTFKDKDNVSSNYNLEIDGSQGESLNLNQFDGTESIKDIEQILLDSGYLTKTNESKDFRIKLPTVLNAYADYQLAKRWYVSGYIQQKLSDDSENDFTTIQNVVTLTPRFSGKNYEIYMPLSQNEISDFTTGFGFRLGGFFLGSGSIVTALINDSTQADVYLGFRIGF